ncbi:hypothetical protein DSO57_1010086 [Entomophthora muscae]|uniref:Uncharacterized protein n=1 Tax=Entomophthora muscae TaxID=34485 RepID=A0ACC2T6I1_9FUNG|nr:hypothetical protein DSO57_1010086 [Entomophthora muscae]
MESCFKRTLEQVETSVAYNFFESPTKKSFTIASPDVFNKSLTYESETPKHLFVNSFNSAHTYKCNPSFKPGTDFELPSIDCSSRLTMPKSTSCKKIYWALYRHDSSYST